MSVGNELLNVPFPQMVRSLAMAIADGQKSLDKSSMETARLLATERVSIIEEIHEVIEARPFAVEYTDPEGNTGSIMVTGATVRSESTPPKPYTLMQAGLFPTFYQFTESIIEVKMSISQRFSSGMELEAGASLGVNYGPVSFAAHVNFKTSQTYS